MDCSISENSADYGLHQVGQYLRKCTLMIEAQHIIHETFLFSAKNHRLIGDVILNQGLIMQLLKKNIESIKRHVNELLAVLCIIL